MTRLRLAESLSAVFYLPHIVAEASGAFREEQLAVQVLTSFGRQWDALERGDADIAIGGPTRNVAHYLRTGTAIVNFCGALRANTWFLIGREPAAAFEWHAIAGKKILGLAEAPQGVCLRWILLRNGVDPASVSIQNGRDVAHEIEMFRTGEGDYLLHSLHSAADLVRSREACVVQELATPTGPVPWSTYAAMPSTLERRRDDLQAFTRAIARALDWIAAQPPHTIAELVAPRFPDWNLNDLSDTLAAYKQLATWPRAPSIPRQEWDRYCAMYVEAGALRQAVSYEVLVDARFAG